MTLEKLLQQFPPNEEHEQWSGNIPGFEWTLQRDSMVGPVSFNMIGIVKERNLHDAIRESVSWMNRFRNQVSQLHEHLARVTPPSALERILEGEDAVNGDHPRNSSSATFSRAQTG